MELGRETGKRRKLSPKGRANAKPTARELVPTTSPEGHLFAALDRELRGEIERGDLITALLRVGILDEDPRLREF
jgi:hypothetical protein